MRKSCEARNKVLKSVTCLRVRIYMTGPKKTKKNKGLISSNADWKIIHYDGIDVYYLAELDGGALDFGEEAFTNTVKKKYRKVGTVCEFCAGPGFIGFALLARGLCKKLCLVDINPIAIECCKKTIKENGLGKRVTTYVSDGLKHVPKKEVWDLVVSNPPHFDGTVEMYKKDIIAIDPGWVIHEKFYKDVPQHLSKNGSVLFLENIVGAPESLWEPMITKNALRFKGIFWEKHPPQKLVKRIVHIISVLNFDAIKRFITLCIKQKNTNFLAQRVYPY